MTENLEASDLVKRCAEPVHAGESVTALIRRAAMRTGMSAARVKSLWYREARAVLAEEMDRLREVVASRQALSERREQSMVSSRNDDSSRGAARRLTHISAKGEARMVDVSDKGATSRVAVAEGRVRMAAATLAAILAGDAKKGDVIGAARIAGIMAAKKTSDLVPLCHSLQLSKAAVDIAPDESLPGLVVRAEARCVGPTGVEMEALTAVSIACLTIYDMAKAIDRGMCIESVRLVEKRGGKSGEWRA